MQQCTQERMSGKETGPLHIKYHLTPNLLHLLPLWREEEDGTVPHAPRNSPHLSPFGSCWWRMQCHVINTSRQRLPWACLSLRARNRRKKWGQTFKQHPHSPRNGINRRHNCVRDNNWGPPSSPLSFRTACYLSLRCHNSASYQYITWLIWQPDHRFAVGMQGTGQENSLFMIQQRLWACADAVANWKMNETWQVFQGNQSDRIGFQYGNAREMITWKWLQRISDFFIFGDNELVCPMGLTTCIILKGNSTKSGLKFQFHWCLLI